MPWHKHRTSIDFMWRHYQSVVEMPYGISYLTTTSVTVSSCVNLWCNVSAVLQNSDSTGVTGLSKLPVNNKWQVGHEVVRDPDREEQWHNCYRTKDAIWESQTVITQEVWYNIYSTLSNGLQTICYMTTSRSVTQLPVEVWTQCSITCKASICFIIPLQISTLDNWNVDS